MGSIPQGQQQSIEEAEEGTKAIRCSHDQKGVDKPELAGLAMAFSSVSVVSNSLLLKRFHPGRKNYLSLFAPIFMGIIFTALFIGFAKVSV